MEQIKEPPIHSFCWITCTNPRKCASYIYVWGESIFLGLFDFLIGLWNFSFSLFFKAWVLFVQCCVASVSRLSILASLVFSNVLKYIQNVQDYNALHNNAVHPVICEGWYLAHIRGEAWAPKTNLTMTLFTEVHAVVYLCVMDNNFASFYDFLLNLELFRQCCIFPPLYYQHIYCVYITDHAPNFLYSASNNMLP